MSRLDNVISELYFIADNLKLLRDIYSTGDCNNCKTRDCGYKVKPGEMVRFNCPFYTNEDKK